MSDPDLSEGKCVGDLGWIGDEDDFETNPYYQTLQQWKYRKQKKICAECPVVDLCLSVAIKEPYLVGVWGGTTENDRKKIRREQGLSFTRRRVRNEAKAKKLPVVITDKCSVVVGGVICERKYLARGCCKAHYQQLMSGKKFSEIRNMSPNELCSVVIDGVTCVRNHHAKGMCKSHHKMMSLGRPLRILESVS
jgi:hypothetical protein